MNKFYIKIFFFLISIFVYVNNTSFATELDSPDDSLEHSLKMGIFMKNNNLITEPASDIDFLVKSNIDYITQDKDYLDNLIPNKEYLDYINQDKDYLDNLIPNKDAQEFENHENRDLLSCTDYEEAKKASEIMCDVIDRLKYYCN
ncbi:hypothetical protein PBNK65E_000489400 [Plasmodium berghei]|uniref:Fam-b protein n=1 Tax=Plasmodium berghei TaxID=5821 RepID=A0A1D3JNM2_PLABE|nr:hypothetical protein PBNK65E_000489400 [Plasmodium berghei]